MFFGCLDDSFIYWIIMSSCGWLVFPVPQTTDDKHLADVATVEIYYHLVANLWNEKHAAIYKRNLRPRLVIRELRQSYLNSAGMGFVTVFHHLGHGESVDSAIIRLIYARSTLD